MGHASGNQPNELADNLGFFDDDFFDLSPRVSSANSQYSIMRPLGDSAVNTITATELTGADIDLDQILAQVHTEIQEVDLDKLNYCVICSIQCVDNDAYAMHLTEYHAKDQAPNSANQQPFDDNLAIVTIANLNIPNSTLTYSTPTTSMHLSEPTGFSTANENSGCPFIDLQQPIDQVKKAPETNRNPQESSTNTQELSVLQQQSLSSTPQRDVSTDNQELDFPSFDVNNNISSAEQNATNVNNNISSAQQSPPNVNSNISLAQQSPPNVNNISLAQQSAPNDQSLLQLSPKAAHIDSGFFSTPDNTSQSDDSGKRVKTKKKEKRKKGKGEFKCDQCPRTFGYKQNLKQHKNKHSGKIRPFQCDQCGKYFSFSQNLLQHKRVHTGLKFYQCKLCPRQFNDAANYHRHMKNIHDPNREQKKKKKPVQGSDEFYEQELEEKLKFTCEKCCMRFMLKESLDRHITKCEKEEDEDNKEPDNPGKSIGVAIKAEPTDKEPPSSTGANPCPEDVKRQTTAKRKTTTKRSSKKAKRLHQEQNINLLQKCNDTNMIGCPPSLAQQQQQGNMTNPQEHNAAAFHPNMMQSGMPDNHIQHGILLKQEIVYRQQQVIYGSSPSNAIQPKQSINNTYLEGNSSMHGNSTNHLNSNNTSLNPLSHIERNLPTTATWTSTPRLSTRRNSNTTPNSTTKSTKKRKPTATYTLNSFTPVNPNATATYTPSSCMPQNQVSNSAEPPGVASNASLSIPMNLSPIPRQPMLGEVWKCPFCKYKSMFSSLFKHHLTSIHMRDVITVCKSKNPKVTIDQLAKSCMKVQSFAHPQLTFPHTSNNQYVSSQLDAPQSVQEMQPTLAYLPQSHSMQSDYIPVHQQQVSQKHEYWEWSDSQQNTSQMNAFQQVNVSHQMNVSQMNVSQQPHAYQQMNVSPQPNASHQLNVSQMNVSPQPNVSQQLNVSHQMNTSQQLNASHQMNASQQIPQQSYHPGLGQTYASYQINNSGQTTPPNKAGHYQSCDDSGFGASPFTFPHNFQ